MAKSSNQKLKLLHILKLFYQNSDEDHPLTMAQIIDSLKVSGIEAERKSIYDDFEALRLFGIDIESIRTNTTAYYIANRSFELPELKLLVDSVQASKFITKKKSFALIKKIENLTSIYEAQSLRRQVYVTNRIKTMNESIYYNVDIIHDAISHNHQISFQYFEYAITKERQLKKNGDRYIVSPFALNWDDEKYYLIGFDAAAGEIRHYRVDKMLSIEETQNGREGQDQFSQLDMAVYAQKTFSMFTGNEQNVTIEFANSMVGPVIDRFGKDIMIIKSDQDHFTITVNVAVSPQFFAWLFGLADKVRVIAPPEVAEQMKMQLVTVSNMYKDNK